MRDGWLETNVGDVCTLEKGLTPTLKATPGEYPLVVTAADFLSSNEYQIDGEAVCVPLVSSTGHGHASLKRVHYASGKFAVANIIAALQARPGASIRMKYLGLLLDHGRNEIIVPLMKGTANVSLSMRSLSQARITLPPLREQERIVDLIAAVDETIEKAATTTERMSSLRDELLKANLSNSGRYPEIMLRELLAHSIGGTWGKDPGNSDVEVISFGTKAYARGASILDPSSGAARSVSRKQYEQRELRAGDLVLEVSGGSEKQAVGRSLFVPWDMPGVVPSSFMRLLRFDPSVASPDWARLLLQRLYVDGTTARLQSNTTSIRNLNVQGFFDAPVEVPPVEKQMETVRLFAAIDEASNPGSEATERLRALRSNLLTALLSGEHVIPESYDEVMGVVS